MEEGGLTYWAMLRTARLILRPWLPTDAAELLPILEANHDRLAPWIPARVATPAPIPELEQRLAGFADNFARDIEWRFAVFTLDAPQLIGEVALFPRDATARVPLPGADRVEIGYWLRADAAGQGFVNEAAQAVIAHAATIPRFSLVELHCDSRNAPSIAVARRLGFSQVAADHASHSLSWSLPLPSRE
ncbi:MAG: rimL [Gemmatimonadetes bacterium]|nr:rimL [Gemmatimonadota bacterium]